MLELASIDEVDASVAEESTGAACAELTQQMKAAAGIKAQEMEAGLIGASVKGARTVNG